MKITYFINFFPSANKIYVQDEISVLLQKGYDVTLIAVWGGDQEKAVKLDFPVIYLDKNKTYWKSLVGFFFKNPFKTISHLMHLFNYLGFRESFKYFSQYGNMGLAHSDRIHAHFASNAALRGLLVSQYYKIPFSCTGHSTELLLVKAPYLKYLIKHANPFITISAYNKKFLANRYSLPEKIIKVNYCGVDTNYYKNTSENRNALPLKIISVTSMRKAKGVEYLVAACQLLKRHNIDFECSLIGGGPNLVEMAALIQKLNLDSNIRLYGAMTPEKIKESLMESSVFVLPSLSEGIPISVMEAMSMELAVIASDITGLPELIDDGVNGYLVEPKKPQLIAEKILFLKNNPGELKKIQSAARKKIEDYFLLMHSVENLIEYWKTYPKKRKKK